MEDAIKSTMQQLMVKQSELDAVKKQNAQMKETIAKNNSSNDSSA